MHSAVGTTLGGVCTIVGEPQNLIIGAFVVGSLSIMQCVWLLSQCLF